MEPTLNQKGTMFHEIDEASLLPWIASLPDSAKPLLDAGCAYGVHSLYAISRGRHVIALDLDERHLKVLEERAEQRFGPRGGGRLVQCITADMPCGNELHDGCVSGILFSEVMHLMKLGQPQQLFYDFFRWLQPGGNLVLTMASDRIVPPFVRMTGAILHGGRTIEDVVEIFEKQPDDVCELAPGYMKIPKEHWFYGIGGETAYMMCAQELRLFAQRAGFEIVTLDYFSSEKYLSVGEKVDGECLWLVARKPRT